MNPCARDPGIHAFGGLPRGLRKAARSWALGITALAIAFATSAPGIPVASWMVRAAAQTQDPQEGTVTLSFVGDILLAGTVGDLIEAEGPLAPWLGVKDVLSASDLSCGNLECAVGTVGEPIPGKTWTFRASPGVLPGLKDSGIDVVSMANNHSLDYGEECLVQGVRLIEDAGVEVIGAGASESEAREPYVFEKNGVKVGILATAELVPDPSWAAGANSAGLAVDYHGWYPKIVQSIRELKVKADIVIVMVHWGDERTATPNERIMPMAKAMEEAGADAIIGSHSHVLQGIRFDGKALIAYSLGNFVFSTRPDLPESQEGAVLTLTVAKSGIQEARVVPTRIVWGKTVQCQDEDRRRVLERLSSLSRPMGTDINESGEVVPLLFSDMNDHWARFTAGRLALRHLIQGYEDGTFQPDKRISKGEFAAMFARIFASTDQIVALPEVTGFDLCSKEHWARPYLNYVATLGLIPPADESWKADVPCTRLDAVLCMWKRAGQPAAATGVGASSADSATAGLEPQARASVEWALSQGILRGYPDGTLRLAEPVSRAETAEILSRYLVAYLASQTAQAPGAR